MNASIKKYILLFFLQLVALTTFGGTVHLSVSTQRGQKTIGVGDVFYISYEISNMDGSPQQPASLPGAKVLYFQRTGSSSSYTSMNGVTSQSRSVIYTLTAKAEKEGTFQYGPVTVGGTKSNSVSYTIGKSSGTSTVPGNSVQQQTTSDSSKPKFIGKGDGNLFLRASVSKSFAYEQEALVYTVKLYTTYDGIKFIGATAAPKFDGFVVEESKATSAQLSYESYQGKTYATAVIARYIIFPQMKGKLKVTGNTYTVSVDQREYYHDPFWGNMSVSSPLQLNVTPNDLQIEVMGLPQPQPVDFSGGVGKFSISSSLASRNLFTNQGASLIYTVTGTGNLKYLHLPDLNSLFPEQIEVYSPEIDVKTQVGTSNVSGTATFDYTLMPLETGSYTLPAVSLCYFNPETGRYERSSATGYQIKVDQGKASSKSQTKDKLRFNPKLLPLDGNLSSVHTPWIEMWGYWMIYIGCMVALMASVVIYRKRLRDLSDIEGLKSRRAGKIARKRLRKAYECMRSGDSSRFYDEMLRALWGYIAHKLKMPTSELTRDNVAQRLETGGVSEGVIRKIIGIIDDCEYAKYTPVANDFNMKDLYDQATAVIYDLEDVIRIERKHTDAHEMSVSERLDRDLSASKELLSDVEASQKATLPTSTQEETGESIVEKDF